LEFKQRVSTNYPELFTGGGQQDDYSAEATFGSKWGWYQSVYGLAKGDVTKFDEITKLNVHECLIYLAFEKEKVELEKKRIRRK
jgi:hypothetical protein